MFLFLDLTFMKKSYSTHEIAYREVISRNKSVTYVKTYVKMGSWTNIKDRLKMTSKCLVTRSARATSIFLIFTARTRYEFDVKE